MTRCSLSISRTLFVAGLALALLGVSAPDLEAQKNSPPSRPRTDEANDMAFCPSNIAAEWKGSTTRLLYRGFLPRGADGIGKVYYAINGIADATGMFASYGTLYVYGWQCRIVGALGMSMINIEPSNVEIIERRINPIYLACGGGGGGDGDPGSGGQAPTTKSVPVRFDCGDPGEPPPAGWIMVTITTCSYNAVFNTSGQYMYSEIVGCHTERYFAMM